MKSRKYDLEIEKPHAGALRTTQAAGDSRRASLVPDVSAGQNDLQSFLFEIGVYLAVVLASGLVIEYLLRASGIV